MGCRYVRPKDAGDCTSAREQARVALGEATTGCYSSATGKPKVGKYTIVEVKVLSKCLRAERKVAMEHDCDSASLATLYCPAGRKPTRGSQLPCRPREFSKTRRRRRYDCCRLPEGKRCRRGCSLVRSIRDRAGSRCCWNLLLGHGKLRRTMKHLVHYQHCHLHQAVHLPHIRYQADSGSPPLLTESVRVVNQCAR